MEKNDKIILDFFMIILIIKIILQDSLYFTIPEIVEIGIEAVCYIYFVFIIIKYLRVNKFKLVIIFIIIMITCYTGFITKNMTLLSSIMIVTVTAIRKDEKIIRISNKVIGITLGIHIIIYCFQMLIGDVHVTPDWSGRTRYLLGFSNPNASGILILWWAIGKIYLSNYNIKKTLIYMGVIILSYYFNRCRSMLYCSIVLLILSICINKNIGTGIIKFLSRNIIIIISIVVIVLTYLYNNGNNKIKKLDEIFSNRIFFSAQAIKENGFTLLGQKTNQSIVKIGNYVGNIVMDVTYIALYYKYGIIYLILLIMMAKYITKTRTQKEYMLLIIYAIFAMLELYSLNFAVCFPILFGANWIGEKNNDT